MNKDLDDRLVPNGEYRDAENISVGKSEADDIGALENILGNSLIPRAGSDTAFINNNNLRIIGYLSDKNNSTLYLFYTDNTNHYIYRYNSANSWVQIATGSFLNFNIEYPITGVNLVEDFLFFTDDYNQPRKVNVKKPEGYYFKENHISVAKYNPYEAVNLLKTTTHTASATSAATTITFATQNTAIKKGMSIIGPNITAQQYIYVTDFSTSAPWTVTTNKNASVTNGDELTFLETTMTGKDITYDFNDGDDWPGDPDFLEDLFVRFSYRFKFDDNEYSLMAPFSQPTYIPRQKGYFIGGDEDAAYRSTILDFMQNGVQNVKLLIPLPDIQNNLNDVTLSTYKIKAIDILYKESDARAVKVLDTVATSTLSSTTSNIYEYDYQSRKPYKTLPERQTIRVYDKVPVKALAQEIAGNRVIYGNFQSQHTPPLHINYNVTANAKSTTAFTTWSEYPNHTLKQNRNYQVGFVLADKFGRQSSVILSSVDSGITLNNTFFGGSTFYHPYKSTSQNLLEWFGDALKVIINSPVLEGEENKDSSTGVPGLYAKPEGNGFNVSAVADLNTAVTIPVLNVAGFEYEFTLVNTTATTDATQYNIGNAVTVTITAGNNDIKVGDSLINNTTKAVYGIVTELTGSATTFKANITATLPQSTTLVFCDKTDVAIEGEYLRGEYEDFVKIAKDDLTAIPVCKVYTETKINEDLYKKTTNNPDTKYAYTIQNPLGWYSYKIVVKQQEQDYYNCYFPGFLNGYPAGAPSYPTGEDGKTGHVVLLNDNINKVPRDLSEVGPEQKQFRSSVQLYGRVNNVTSSTNKQFFPVSVTDTQYLPLSMTADTIGDANDLKMATSDITSDINFYQLDTNPLIARLATLNAGTTTIGLTNGSMEPVLTIAETEPVETLLQLFYETSTAGLIADLNADVNTGFDGVAGLSSLSYLQNENMTSGTNVTQIFFPQTNQGVNINNSQISNVDMVVTNSATPPVQLASVNIDASGNVTNSPGSLFTLIESGGGYRIQTNANTFVYNNDSAVVDQYNFSFTFTKGADTNTVTTTGALTNIDPEFNVGASLPNVTVSAGDNTGVARPGNNGSNSQSTSDLNFSIFSQTPGSYFSIDQSGTVTKNTSTPIGVYTLQLKLEDAFDGTAGTGSESITKQQIITVGAEAINATAKSGCETSIVVTNASMFGAALPYTTDATDPRTAVWYLAANAITNDADLPVTPSSPDTGVSDYKFRLGTAALTQGTIVFQCNMQQKKHTAGPAGVEGKVDWLVYYRVNSSSAWNLATDTNNNTASSGTVTIAESSQGATQYASVAFAFDEAGEYAVVASSAYASIAPAQDDSLGLWVNSNDLYYNTCVVENGLDVTNGNTPKRYQYDLGSAGTSFNCSSTGNTPRYAPMPYAQYVDLFYEDSGLTNPWTHEAAGNTTPFYSFKTSSGQPFDQVRVSAKFGSDGLKISSSISGCTPDAHARACVNNSTVCSQPTPGAGNWV